MGFEMKHNPLEQNPLFQSREEIPETSPGLSEAPVTRRKKKAVTDTSSTLKTAENASEKLSEGSSYVRATFIVREDLLQTLKAYAYTARRPLKCVVNEILADSLGKIQKEYADRGEELLKPR